MTLSEMHVWFRQYAQQMGMQNVRALLPEQIDLLINTSITDTINQIIVQNIGVTNDRIITDNSKIGQINALKTLYTVKSIKIFDSEFKNTNQIGEEGQSLTGLLKGDWEILEGNMVFTFSVGDGDNYDVNTTSLTAEQIINSINTYIKNNLNNFFDENIFISISGYTDRNFIPHLKAEYYVNNVMQISVNSEEGIYEFSTLTPNDRQFSLNTDGVYKGLITSNSVDISYLYLVDFAIDYKKSDSGITQYNMVDFDANGFTTKLFPVRLIDDIFLADTLNDFILSPRLRSPILTVNANNYDLYFGEFVKLSNGNYTLDNNLVPYNLRISYIAKPNKVEYRLDKGFPTNIECNLPEYLHVDILKHAVDLYRASISGSLLSQQAQDQQQQREIARNNATPSDGYPNN